MAAYSVIIDPAGGFAVEVVSAEGRRTVSGFATEQAATDWMIARQREGDAEAFKAAPAAAPAVGPATTGHRS